jgi:hypothetical protein
LWIISTSEAQRLESREHDSIRLKITEQAEAAHLEGVLAAIRSAARAPGKPEVADALVAAIGKQQGRARALASKHEQEEEQAARREEEEAVISALQVELQARVLDR